VIPNSLNSSLKALAAAQPALKTFKAAEPAIRASAAAHSSMQLATASQPTVRLPSAARPVMDAAAQARWRNQITDYAISESLAGRSQTLTLAGTWSPGPIRDFNLPSALPADQQRATERWAKQFSERHGLGKARINQMAAQFGKQFREALGVDDLVAKINRHASHFAAVDWDAYTAPVAKSVAYANALDALRVRTVELERASTIWREELEQGHTVAEPVADDIEISTPERVSPLAHRTLLMEGFEDAHEWLERCCPKALSRINGAYTAYEMGEADYAAQMSVGCRRALEVLADFLCPPSEPKEDRHGAEHKLEDHQYKNRLLRYLDQAANPKGHYKLVDGEIKLLITRMDVLADRLQKGVHDDATKHDARTIFFYPCATTTELQRAASS
jgi:hypothetical protein